MAITKNIVDMMGGTIDVQTEQGKGTEFIVCLPFRIQSEKHHTRRLQRIQSFRLRVQISEANVIACGR